MQAIMVSEFGGPRCCRSARPPCRSRVTARCWCGSLPPGSGRGTSLSAAAAGPAPLPYIPGGEFAGIVVGDTGADAALDDGALVYGYPGLTGCYAQYVTCPAEKLAPIPAGLPVTDAAAAPIDALTAEQGLTDELGSRPATRC